MITANRHAPYYRQTPSVFQSVKDPWAHLLLRQKQGLHCRPDQL